MFVKDVLLTSQISMVGRRILPGFFWGGPLGPANRSGELLRTYHDEATDALYQYNERWWIVSNLPPNPRHGWIYVCGRGNAVHFFSGMMFWRLPLFFPEWYFSSFCFWRVFGTELWIVIRWLGDGALRMRTITQLFYWCSERYWLAVRGDQSCTPRLWISISGACNFDSFAGSHSCTPGLRFSIAEHVFLISVVWVETWV